MAYRLAQKKSHSAFSRKVGFSGWMQQQISFHCAPDDPEMHIYQTCRFVEGPSTQPNHDAIEGLFGRVKPQCTGAQTDKQKEKKVCIVSREKKATAKHMFSNMLWSEHLVSSQQCFSPSSTYLAFSFIQQEWFFYSLKHVCWAANSRRNSNLNTQIKFDRGTWLTGTSFQPAKP